MRELPDDVLFDKRLIGRHIRQGLLKESDLEKRLNQASDLEAQADFIDMDAMQAEIENARPRSHQSAA